MKNNKNAGKSAGLTLLATILLCQITGVRPCLAADWGYDNQPPAKETPAPDAESTGIPERSSVLPPTRHEPLELEAQPRSLKLPAKTSPKKTPAKQETSEDTQTEDSSDDVAPEPAKTAPEPDSSATSDTVPIPAGVVGKWLNLLGLIAPVEEMSQLPKAPNFHASLLADQKRRFIETLNGLLAGKDGKTLESISLFWAGVDKAAANEEQMANYRLLFRSLLRRRAQSSTIPSEEKEMLMEALGPQRVALSGEPPLTEEAINAYADMACFLYEKNFPGRTVDADDNRQVFIKVIKQKFEDAPRPEDKAAMNNFPISWAKFRIMYIDSSLTDRKAMESKIVSETGLAGMNIKNATLERVLRSPLWGGPGATAKAPEKAVGGNSAGTSSSKPKSSGGKVAKPKVIKRNI